MSVLDQALAWDVRFIFQLVQFVVAQRRGRAGARQPRQPRRQWRAGASRGEQGSEQCGAPDFFDGLGPWACQEAAGWEKLAKNSRAGPGGGSVTEAAIGTRSLVTGVKFFYVKNLQSLWTQPRTGTCDVWLL